MNYIKDAKNAIAHLEAEIEWFTAALRGELSICMACSIIACTEQQKFHSTCNHFQIMEKHDAS